MRSTRIPLLTLVGFLAGSSARADLTVEKPFLGVTYTHFWDTPAGGPSLTYDLVDIDLSAPGIGFKVSPGLTNQFGLSAPQTTRQFVTAEHAQIGINANFFAIPQPFLGGFQINGVAASNGTQTASHMSGFSTVNIGADNQTVTFFTGDPIAQGATLYNAVSGFGRLIDSGVIVADTSPGLFARSAIARTAANHLLLLTIDGNQPGHSDGATLVKEAQILLGYGAVDAVNLDGGGSSTLVIADPTPTVVNVPSGSPFPVETERVVAVNLAVFASPMSVPEPGSMVLLIGGAAGIGVRAIRNRRRADAQAAPNA